MGRAGGILSRVAYYYLPTNASNLWWRVSALFFDGFDTVGFDKRHESKGLVHPPDGKKTALMLRGSIDGMYS